MGPLPFIDLLTVAALDFKCRHLFHGEYVRKNPRKSRNSKIFDALVLLLFLKKLIPDSRTLMIEPWTQYPDPRTLIPEPWSQNPDPGILIPELWFQKGDPRVLMLRFWLRTLTHPKRTRISLIQEPSKYSSLFLQTFPMNLTLISEP